MKRTFLGIGVVFFVLATTDAPALAQRQKEPIYDEQPLSFWLKQLESKDRRKLNEAHRALVTIGKPAVPALITMMQRGYGNQRQAAIHALVRMGKTAVPGLIYVLQNGSRDDQTLAAQALKSIGKPALPALAVVAKSRIATMRYHVMEAMMGSGPDAVPYLLPFFNLWSDHDAAVYALAKIGPSGLPQMIKALETGSWHERQGVAKAIANMGASAKKAGPALLRQVQMKQVNPGTFATALAAIRADAKQTVPPLIALLENEVMSNRIAAARALASYGADGVEAIPALRIMQNDDPTENGRREAAQAIKTLERHQ